jgi:IS5 family transposase
LHAVLCAAGFNIRWLLRMIVKKGIGLFLRLLQVAVLGKWHCNCGRFLYHPNSNPVP